MIVVTCDNCNKTLRNSTDMSGAEPEKRVNLIVQVDDSSKRIIDMDLCVNCAKRYVGVLKQPF